MSWPAAAMTRVATKIADNDLASFEKVSKAIARGDLTQSIVIQSEPVKFSSSDELGILAHELNRMIQTLHDVGEVFNEMTTGLKTTVGQIYSSAESMGASSDALADVADRTEQLTSQISRTMQQVAQGSIQQSRGASETAQSMEQIVKAIDGVSGGAQEQAEGVNKASEAVTNMSTAIQDVTAHELAVMEGAKEVAGTARSGEQTVSESIRVMENIRQKTREAGNKVKEMGSRSEEISKIVETIEEISTQTNLLALNAAIEAARAGEHGKGFAVVADEVRKLAERSSVATKEVSSLINDVQASAVEAVKAMQAGAQEVDTGVIIANKSGDALKAIIRAVENVTRETSISRQSLENTKRIETELINAIDKVSGIVDENMSATEQLSASSSMVSQSVKSIAVVSEQNSAAVNEVNLATEQMNSQAQETSTAAQQLALLSQDLRYSLSRFKTE
jgi:methyl-accepting chemotaxis protein